MSIEQWLFNNIIAILTGAIIPIVLLIAKYFKETPAEKTSKELELMSKYENLYNLVEKRNDDLGIENKELKIENRQYKMKIDEIDIKMLKMETEIENLKSCKKRYYMCLDWIKDNLNIANREGFVDKLSMLPSKIKNDVEKR